MIPRVGEGGFTSLQFAVVAFFSMVVFAAVLNLVAMQYQRGAVRFAVDEGARHGATAGFTEGDCEMLAEQILRNPGSGLLRGELGDTVTVQCAPEGTEMVATASGSSRWWFGRLPDIPFTIIGRAVIESFTDTS